MLPDPKVVSLAAEPKSGTDFMHVLSVAAPPALKVLGVLIAVVVAGRLSKRLVDKAPENLQRQVGYTLPILIKVAGLLVLLSLLGVQISAVTGLLAAVGLGATLLLTPVGQNLIAGFLAGIDDVVAMGDVIKVGDEIGRVVRKGTLSLGVELPDGSVVYVPNTKAIDDEMINYTRARGDRVDVEVPIDQPERRHETVKVIQAAIEPLEWRVQDLPAEVIFDSIQGDSLVFVASVWVEDRFDVRRYRSLLLTAVVDALDEAGITVGDTASIELRGPLGDPDWWERRAPDAGGHTTLKPVRDGDVVDLQR